MQPGSRDTLSLFSRRYFALRAWNNGVELIRKRQREMNYVRAVDQQLESLSAAEQKKIEEEEARQKADPIPLPAASGQMEGLHFCSWE